MNNPCSVISLSPSLDSGGNCGCPVNHWANGKRTASRRILPVDECFVKVNWAPDLPLPHSTNSYIIHLCSWSSPWNQAHSLQQPSAQKLPLHQQLRDVHPQHLGNCTQGPVPRRVLPLLQPHQCHPPDACCTSERIGGTNRQSCAAAGRVGPGYAAPAWLWPRQPGDKMRHSSDGRSPRVSRSSQQRRLQNHLTGWGNSSVDRFARSPISGRSE